MSVIDSARALVHQLGFHVHRWPSEQHLRLEYPISSAPRYGVKTAPLAPMVKMLDFAAPEMGAMMDRIAARKDLIASIPDISNGEPFAPYWKNGWFFKLDALALMHNLLETKPARYIEIGSGFSTMFTNHARTFGKLDLTITSIDPQPRAGIDTICDEIIRQPLQDLDFSIFDRLDSGDILFFDGSHYLFQDSDVAVFFLEVLPRIRPGVLVHIHDIFLPYDYPTHWGERYYNEQYMLALLLMNAPDRYRTQFASHFAGVRFPDKVAALGHQFGDREKFLDASYWFWVR